MKSNNELVTEIHEAFYSAEDRLLEEAKSLIENPRVDKALYAERLSKLGFGAAKPVKDATEIAQTCLKASETVKAIEYFRVYYPNNKFITEAEVKKICDKYGLLLGDSSNYTGDVPEKNLVEIERFSLRKEDWTEKKETWGNSLLEWFSGSLLAESTGIIQSKSRRTGSLASYFGRVNSQLPGMIPAINGPATDFGYVYGADPYAAEKKVELEQAVFKICAPKEDFNTMGYVVMDGYRLVYDPVVLQPVKGGYLIVTAWGQESSDELVINEANN